MNTPTTIRVQEDELGIEIFTSIKLPDGFRRREFRGRTWKSVMAVLINSSARILWMNAFGRFTCKDLNSGCGGLHYRFAPGPLGGTVIRPCAQETCRQHLEQIASYWKDVRLEVTQQELDLVPIEWKKFFTISS